MVILIIGFVLNMFAEVKYTNLTVYNNNIGVVNQKISQKCSKGISKLVIPNMPKTIVSDSIRINLPKDFTLNLLSYKSTNQDDTQQSISVLTKDNTFIEGTLYKKDDNQVIIKNKNDEYIVILNDYIKYINYGKFNEEEFKNKMINNGVLTLYLDSKSDTCDFDLNYIINGISWAASYDAYLDDNETNLDIQGRIVLNNNSGYNYVNSKISLVAGTVNRVSTTEMRAPFLAKSAISFEEDSEQSQTVKPQEFSEYYRYNLPYKELTINDNESISINMFSKDDIKFKKLYVYKGQRDLWYFYDNLKNYKYNTNLDLMFIFKNDKTNNIDIPLPEGRVRVYKKNGDFVSLVGEDNIKHSPIDSEIEINIGKAFNVSGKRKIIEHKKIMQNIYRDKIEISIKNDKNEDINVKIKEYLWGNWKIVESNVDYKKIDINNIEFDVKVPQKTEYKLVYIAEYDFNQ